MTTTVPAHPAETPTTFAPWRAEANARLLAALPEHLGRARWDRPRIVAHQRTALRELLDHARRHSPFHARRLAGIDLASVEPTDLSALPVMTKTDLMAHFDEILTDRRVTREAAEAALAATGGEPIPMPGGHVALTSGGSSGQRGVFVLDTDAIVQFVASLTRGLAARIAALGGPPPGGLPVAIVAAGSAAHPTGLAAPMTAAGELPFRYLPVPATLPVPEMVDRLNALRPPMLYGYPSLLARLADEQRAGRLDIAPVAVTSTSETLTDELRATIRRGLGAPIVDSFGSTEGLVGASGPDEDVITFAEDGCIVELVDRDHRPVPPGTPSARVLLTVLTNRAQPLVRYELTDSLVAAAPAAEHGYLRARVHGRCDDVFTYGATSIHPFVLRAVLARTPQVTEYQVRQTPRGVDLDVVEAREAGAGPALDPADLRDRIARALTAAGLSDPLVVVHPVPALARHPLTGKLRRFVPLDPAGPDAADQPAGPRR